MSKNTADLEERPTAAQWHTRPLAAMAVRVVLLLCPVSVAALLGLLVSRSLPAPTATQPANARPALLEKPCARRS